MPGTAAKLILYAGQHHPHRPVHVLKGAVDAHHRGAFRDAVACQHPYPEFLRVVVEQRVGEPLRAAEDMAHGREIVGVRPPAVALEKGGGAAQDRAPFSVGQLGDQAVMEGAYVKECLRAEEYRDDRPHGKTKGVKQGQGVEEMVLTRHIDP